MDLRLSPSSDQFEEANFLSEWIARLKNPHMFFDLKDMSEVERLETLEKVERLFEEMFH